MTPAGTRATMFFSTFASHLRKECFYDAITPPERLRRFMDRVGRKQAELAEATGIPDSTISAMLAGTRQISKDCAVRLAEHFGVSVQHFIKGAKAAKKGRAT